MRRNRIEGVTSGSTAFLLQETAVEFRHIETFCSNHS
jgi:hypothetical protein